MSPRPLSSLCVKILVMKSIYFLLEKCCRNWFVIYHASMSDVGSHRSRNSLHVIVATSAFGLAVDVPDINQL